MTHRQHDLEGKPSINQAMLEGRQYSKYDKFVTTKNGIVLYSSNNYEDYLSLRADFLEHGVEIETIKIKNE